MPNFFSLLDLSIVTDSGRENERPSHWLACWISSTLKSRRLKNAKTKGPAANDGRNNRA